MLSGEENADEMRMGNDGKPRFLSNHAGGILGGISTGQPIVARFAVKPTSSILSPRRTVDRHGAETEIVTKGRHDPASASARCRSAKPWWPACSPITIYVTAARSALPSNGRSPSEAEDLLSDNHQRVGDVVDAFKRGEIVVVTDDDDRENEAICSSPPRCAPEKMAFIIRHTSGIVCAPLSAEEAKRLRLDPMVALNDAPLGTAFTVSVDVRHGLTTGISAEHRRGADRQPQQRAGRLRTAGPRVSAGGQERRADALRPYRRPASTSATPRRPGAGRRARRADERRRHGDARARRRRFPRRTIRSRLSRSQISSPTARCATSWCGASPNSR